MSHPYYSRPDELRAMADQLDAIEGLHGFASAALREYAAILMVGGERDRCASAARGELADAESCGNVDAADAARRILDCIEHGPSAWSPAGEYDP